MLSKAIAGLIAGSVLFGAASAAWSAAPVQPGEKILAVQPSTTGEGAQSPSDVPPPALPNPVKKKSFFPIAGLGLLVAAGTGAAVAAGGNDNPASP